MHKAISLHLGLNVVDVNHYGDEMRLYGCHNDARDMAAIARTAGYEAMLLLDRDATSSRLLECLSAAQQELSAGDALLLTYAGHGSQVPDEDGDESDAKDETWVLFDRMFIDDELRAMLAGFDEGVRILVISDSCHSGTIARMAQYDRLLRAAAVDSREYGAPPVRFRTPADPAFGSRVWNQNKPLYQSVKQRTPSRDRSEVRAAVIQISGCQDEQLSADGETNGLFTSKLKEVWASGRFKGGHNAFARAIRAALPLTQIPNYLTFGNQVTAFQQQRPFTAEPPRPGAALSSAQGAKKGSGRVDEERAWAEVRSQLEQRFPGWRAPTNVLGAGGALTFSGAGEEVRAPSGAPIVRTFWWGFHIECSSQGLRDFLSVADPVNAIAAAIGPLTGPAAPFVLAAAAFIKGALQLLRGLDRGNGVYISMSWFAPGVFIPTTVPGRALKAATPRGGGEPYEVGGDPWRRSYGGGLFGLRMEEDIYWNLPDGTVRDGEPIVILNPPRFGNVYFNHWLSPDPTVGHFRLHVGVAAFQGGAVEIRMMVRDAEGRRAMRQVTPGPRVLTHDELSAPSARESSSSPSADAERGHGSEKSGGWNGYSQHGFVGAAP